jgi:uncharacterized protein (DUF433 family)
MAVITSKAEVQGGDFCVDGTRLPVDVILVHVICGYSDAEIEAGFPSATPDTIDAARSWAVMRHIDLSPHPTIDAALARLRSDMDRIRAAELTHRLSAAE